MTAIMIGYLFSYIYANSATIIIAKIKIAFAQT